jgi:hypothetical protein
LSREAIVNVEKAFKVHGCIVGRCYFWQITWNSQLFRHLVARIPHVRRLETLVHRNIPIVQNLLDVEVCLGIEFLLLRNPFLERV